MKHVFINYVVQDGHTDENTELIEKVLAQVAEIRIRDMEYAAYKVGGNVFVHIARFDTPEAEQLFTALPAFQAFRATMDQRLKEKPIVNETKKIGAYSNIGT